MAKETILYGEVKFRETNISEDLTARLLGIDASGNLVDRPAVDSSTFVSTALADGRVWIGSALGVATAVNTSAVGDIDADSLNGLTIKAGTIVDADINGTAAIAYSKLSLASSIVNADISSTAAIAYSKLNLTGLIVNADIAAGAAIARTKIASGTGFRLLVNNVAGVMSENAEITADKALISDANGQPIHSSTTATEIAFVSGLDANLQDQLDNEVATKTVKAVVKNPTVAEHGYAITWDNASGTWDLTDPVTQGIPLGGNTREVLAKIDGSDWNAGWTTLVLSDISDVSSLADDLNLLVGAAAAGLTTTHLSYLIGATSNLQTQINNKLSSTLAENAMFVGSSSHVPTSLPAGSNGQVLTIASGVPTWQTLSGTGTVTSVDVSGGTTGLTTSGGPVSTSGTITLAGTLIAANGGTGFTSYTVGDILYASTTTAFSKLGVGSNGEVLTLAGGVPTWAAAPGGGVANSAVADELMKSDGVDAIASGLFSTSDGNVTMGASGGSGTLRILAVAGTQSNINLRLDSKGTGEVILSLTDTTAVARVKSLLQSSATNTVEGVHKLTHVTTATPVTGIGTALEFEVMTASGPSNYEVGGRMEAVTTDVTGGSEDFDFVWKLMTAGAAAAEKMRLSSTGVLTLGGFNRIWGTSDSIYIGPSAGNLSTTGVRNTIIGYQAGDALTTGSNNAVLGYHALTAAQGANGNIAIGYVALGSVVSGNQNVGIGQLALTAVTGSTNIGIGKNAGDNITSGSNNIVIGQDGDVVTATASNQLNIQNMIWGIDNAGTGTTASSGKIGIGVSTPLAKFHVHNNSASNYVTYHTTSNSIGGTDDIIETFYEAANKTTTATQNSAGSIDIPASTTMFIEVVVVARRTGGVAGTDEDGAAYHFAGTFKNVGGVATQIGSTSNYHTAESQAGWSAAFSLSVDTVTVQIIGATDNDITWFSYITTRQATA